MKNELDAVDNRPATWVQREADNTADPLVDFQLTRSLLSIQLDFHSGRSLARIPVNSIVRQTTTFSPIPGLIEVLWQGHRYLVFAEDLKMQQHLSTRVY